MGCYRQLPLPQHALWLYLSWHSLCTMACMPNVAMQLFVRPLQCIASWADSKVNKETERLKAQLQTGGFLSNKQLAQLPLSSAP
ncbi:hypothetical protein COO60DRAFT_892510 [Scenedesmus sp. NREL 46B-D3]|nr:hypothetical protein COO60DRAFT_892510 [Scenedesmus sp. NREL 46B-D3]